MLGPDVLRLLALIERHGSLSAAAQVLGVTPAAVTQQVARAERDCRAKLVRRGPRGAALTEAGLALAVHGQIVDAATVQAAGELDALLGRLSVRLRIGAFQAAALRLLPPALTALRHRHPDADLSIMDLVSERGIPAVAAGELDVAVIASWDRPPVPPDHVALQPLLTDPMVVVLAAEHPLAAEPGAPIGLEQLRGEAWVAIRAGHAARAQFDRAAAAAGFLPKIRFETESYDVAQAFVATGIGVALVSRLALTHLPGTVHRRLASPGLGRQVHAVSLADHSPTPMVAQFLRLLHDVADDVSAR
ncbi:LysR family transcriptional regulator [Catellatospora sp. TT07R-123]|uniref:LysR family transcriptional regulator n=1 Tax=Catellatospora sp. TT07R-123 TaxID=2733863 RepID=UPI001B1A6943|nr:LysR family transcriptional regulator [Catellatospora sp. TT07R-123]GHJ43364.1 LysR family transcriptional regulator [Catellatospora sp. TT07R-123]